MKDQLKKVKCELNEIKSLKLFVEKKLQQVETSLKNEESAKASEIQSLNEKLEFQIEKNQELAEELDSISARYEENEVSKEHLTKVVNGLRHECNSWKLEISRTTAQVRNIYTYSCTAQNFG
jgi:chromosome segregation ATPase